MKVSMNVNTRYQGKSVLSGEVIEVDEKTALRWHERGIAAVAIEVEESPYTGLKAKELYELCVSRGIEAEAKKSKDHYLELLIAFDTEVAEELKTGEDSDGGTEE